MQPTTSASTDLAGASQNQKTEGVPQGPIEAIDFGTTGQLFDEIRAFLAQHPGLTTDAVLKLAYFAFAILFSERTPIWPFASVVAPDPVGATLLLRLVACVCVAPLQIGELRLDAILTLPPKLRPSLLIVDQLAPNRELERVLRLMSRPAGCILRKGELYNVCIPTLVCTAAPLRDRWITDQAFQIVLTPSRGPLPKLDSESLNESARNFRGKLRRYQEVNIAKVRSSQFDAPSFSSPTREMACMLGASIVDDPALQHCVLMILESQDQDVRIRRTDSIPAVMVEAQLFLSHEEHRRHARMAEIGTIANGILKGRGEIFEIDPREVGNHLRALGFFSERLGSAGRGIRFTNAVRRKIHELAQAFDVRTELKNPFCEFCEEARSRAVEAPEPGS
jgi:hypothetical protein